MKAIVFGGSGFLGSHVADALTEDGHEVTVYDRSRSPYLRFEQRMVVGDILDFEKVRKATQGQQVILHYAGLADIDEASRKPLETVRANVLGTVTLLEVARQCSVERFVFASSLYVYSKAGSFYRSSKQACELYIEEYDRSYGLKYTIVRYGSLYGSRADSRNWIHRILTQALTEGRITRHGDGEEIREYIHVEDAAQCTTEILKPEYANQHVILSGVQQMRIKDVLAMICEMLGNSIEVQYLPANDRIHYEVTPFHFKPKPARKLVRPYYWDFGQGLYNCLQEIYSELSRAGKLPETRATHTASGE